MRYQWEQAPNRQIGVLHVSEKLPRAWMVGDSIEDVEDADEETVRFARNLAEIPGVENVTFRGYQCSIEKALVFEWPPIRAAVEEMFRRRYGDMEPVASPKVVVLVDGQEQP